MKKKICFLVDSIFSIGGVQRVTAIIAEALSMTYDVTIITFDKESQKDLTLYNLKHYPISYQFVSYLDIGFIMGYSTKLYSFLYRKVLPKLRLTSDWYAQTSLPGIQRDMLTALLTEQHYEAVIAVHSFLAIRLATLKPRLQGTKTIGWIHNSFDALTRKGSHYLGEELKAHYGWQLEKLDETVVLYHQDAEEYRKAYGFLPKVIYNPLTLTPGPVSDGSQKRFLAVGRLSPLHKGFDLLIEAFTLFAQRNTDWQLDIVGDGPEKDALQRMIAERQMAERIKLHPFTNQIQQYYSSTSIYVLSSRWEGMPLVLVEAMAHGLPIIASDLPTCKEVLGDFGLLFENGNVQAMALRLEEATRIDWPKKSAEAIEIARQFDVNQIVKQWEQLIECQD